MRAAIILFPGSNREGDAARAVEAVSGKADIVWHAEHDLPKGTDLVILPGGFSYGDYLRCGAIAARAPVMDAVRRHAERGGMVLAICNGFQIACEAGLLPGVLMRNAGRVFACRFQHLLVERADSPFTSGYRAGQIIKVCIAHGEGNYVADDATLAALEGEGRVAFRYCAADGSRGGASNPNGSIGDIAGILSPNRRVLGMMPHPENLIDAKTGGVDGLPLFQGIKAAFAEAA
jgi:phosphoribosylformylglycinamidine synthase subunit PurQ / glutaminase